VKMSYEPPDYTDAEILADFEVKAKHWENEARNSSPDIAAVCLDYAKHIRTMIECHRQNMPERHVVSD
jgi:hypothetical protein